MPAAEKIQRELGVSKSHTPFFTPMVIASWRPIADSLVQQGIAANQGSYYTLDMAKFLPLIQNETRWKDIPGNSAFPANKSVLIGSTELTGRFSRFRGREEISIITFSGEVDPAQDFRVANTDPQGPDMQRIREFVDSLTAGGNTALYSALTKAYQEASAAQAQDPDRYYSIVLMSDGASNMGMDAGQFSDFYRSQPAAARGIRAFPVIFGKADRTTMEGIAAITGGRAFDGTRDPLDAIFKQIRGYQ